MTLARFKTITLFDVDMETGKSRIVQHYTTRLGDNTKLVYKKPPKAPKPEPESITVDEPEEVSM